MPDQHNRLFRKGKSRSEDLSQSDRIRGRRRRGWAAFGFDCVRQRRAGDWIHAIPFEERGPNGAHTGGGGRRQRSRACTVGRAALLGSLVLARRRLSTAARARRRACGSPRARVGWPFGPGSMSTAWERRVGAGRGEGAAERARQRSPAEGAARGAAAFWWAGTSDIGAGGARPVGPPGARASPPASGSSASLRPCGCAAALLGGPVTVSSPPAPLSGAGRGGFWSGGDAP